MNHRSGDRRRPRVYGTPLLAGLALLTSGVSACNDEKPSDARFAAETYDESFEAVTPQGRASLPGLAADGGDEEGGAAGAGGSGAGGAGPAGSAGKGGGTAGAGGAGGGTAGAGGKAGAGGGGPAGAGGAGGGNGGVVPAALWHFDDCSDVNRTLFDSSGNGIHATRTVSTACAEGIVGRAVAFDEGGDRVEAPNAPQLALDRHLAVAAWINPERVDDNRPVVLKRLQNKTAFSLRVQNGQIQFSVTLDSGKTVTSAAPVAANQWSHVAGLYDGRFVFLFLNGEQVGQIFAEGSIRDVDVPLRVGGTTQTQRFVGRIDEVLVSTTPTTPADVLGLSCIRRPGELEIDPASGGPVPAGTTLTYGVRVHNRDVGRCAPRTYVTSVAPPPGFDAFSDPFFVENVPPDSSADVALNVTSFDDAEPGVTTIPFEVVDVSSFTEPLPGQVTYELAGGAGCQVRSSRELLIRDTSVVDDPVRTNPFAPPDDARAAAWTFGRLLADAAPTPEQAPDLVEQLFSTWLDGQTVNSFALPSRPSLGPLVLDAWPRTADGRLDLQRAPLNLLAVVNRFDLRDLAQGNAGEGRFVFGVLDPGGFPMQFTVILEYKLPASSEADVLDWAQRWHALSQLPFPSEGFNAALQDVTERFAGRGAAPGSPNGSALLRVRTNEIALSAPWELREFHFDDAGFLRPAPVAVTPEGSFNGGEALARFVNQNEAVILTERHAVPDRFEGSPFLAGAILNNIDFWTAPGIANNEARHKFSLNTCNGCHGAETGTAFLHVFPRVPGSPSNLSGFMTGAVVPDPATGEPRQLNDLGRRRDDLAAIVCAPEPGARSAAGANGTSLRKGISRAH